MLKWYGRLIFESHKDQDYFPPQYTKNTMNTREARGHQRQARTNSYLNELDVPVALAGQEAHVGVMVVEGNQDSGKIRRTFGNGALKNVKSSN